MHEVIFDLTRRAVESHFAEELPLLLADGDELAKQAWDKGSIIDGLQPQAAHSGLEGLSAEQIMAYTAMITAFTAFAKMVIKELRAGRPKPLRRAAKARLVDELKVNGIRQDSAEKIGEDSIEVLLDAVK